LGACMTHCFQIIISSGLCLLMLMLAFLWPSKSWTCRSWLGMQRYFFMAQMRLLKGRQPI
jgi:hypothetical protein